MSAPEIVASTSAGATPAAALSTPVSDADAMLNYFAEHKVESLLSEIVVALGKERPADPTAFIAKMMMTEPVLEKFSSSAVED